MIQFFMECSSCCHAFDVSMKYLILWRWKKLLGLLSSESLLLLKNNTVFRTRYTADFTVRKWSVTARQWDRSQNHETWKVCDWMLRGKHRICVTDQVHRHLPKKTKKKSVLKKIVKSLRYTDEFLSRQISPFWKLPALYNCKV